MYIIDLTKNVDMLVEWRVGMGKLGEVEDSFSSSVTRN